MPAETVPFVTIPDRIRAFLAAPHVVTIGTTGADGAPHQAVAWYRLEPDDRILLNSRYPRRWPADLQRDPRVSLAGHDAAPARLAEFRTQPRISFRIRITGAHDHLGDA